MTEVMNEKSIFDRMFPGILIILVVFTQGVKGFYSIYDLSPSGSFSLISYFLLFWLIGYWFIRDNKNQKIEWIHDMGFFLYIFWPIFIPYYLFRTRGLKKASLITMGFVFLYCGTYVLSYELLYDIAP